MILEGLPSVPSMFALKRIIDKKISFLKITQRFHLCSEFNCSKTRYLAEYYKALITYKQNGTVPTLLIPIKGVGFPLLLNHNLIPV